MSGPGEIANDLRAQVRYWHRRLPKSSRLIAHMRRAAELIEAAVKTGPRKGLIKRLRRACGWMRVHAQEVAHWRFVYGAPSFQHHSTARCAVCMCLLWRQSMPFDDQRKGGGGGGGSSHDDLAAVMFFLRGAAVDGAIYNTYCGREAFDAMARLIGYDPAALWEKTARTNDE